MLSVSEPKIVKSPSYWAVACRKFVKNNLAMSGLIFIVLLVLISVFAPVIATQDITRVQFDRINLKPSSEHWLGTDGNGRDVLTRLIHGGRASLTIGFSCVVLVTVIGTIIGAAAGYFGGKPDDLLMRFTDFIILFPFLPFVIVVNAIFIGKISGVTSLILVIGALSWGGTARIVRSKVLAEKENEYVLAAVSIGTKPWNTIARHILPNVLSAIIVQATLLLASFIVVESALSAIGFGVPQNVPTWGNMLSEARAADVLRNKPWQWMPPAVMVTLTVLAINFVGEGLKDAFNPKSAR
ncbi:oligopeptide ABC transporter permease [Paenibacillus alkalitolerans]|uniref:oligopeptide ABC transporter permease n=1 Tax=Paenibacillus alkalitolerans TaxID=2799335 RepID=UPI0018F76A19|nr:oligopeptide ABC transporter permease [Paenibacillus alkalitolerans]